MAEKITTKETTTKQEIIPGCKEPISTTTTSTKQTGALASLISSVGTTNVLLIVLIVLIFIIAVIAGFIGYYIYGEFQRSSSNYLPAISSTLNNINNTANQISSAIPTLVSNANQALALANQANLEFEQTVCCFSQQLPNVSILGSKPFAGLVPPAFCANVLNPCVSTASSNVATLTAPPQFLPPIRSYFTNTYC